MITYRLHLWFQRKQGETKVNRKESTWSKKKEEDDDDDDDDDDDEEEENNPSDFTGHDAAALLPAGGKHSIGLSRALWAALVSITFGWTNSSCLLAWTCTLLQLPGVSPRHEPVPGPIIALSFFCIDWFVLVYMFCFVFFFLFSFLFFFFLIPLPNSVWFLTSGVQVISV